MEPSPPKKSKIGPNAFVECEVIFRNWGKTPALVFGCSRKLTTEDLTYEIPEEGERPEVFNVWDFSEFSPRMVPPGADISP
jgi:hypothetical protein